MIKNNLISISHWSSEHLESSCHFLNESGCKDDTHASLGKCHNVGERRGLTHELWMGSFFRNRNWGSVMATDVQGRVRGRGRACSNALFWFFGLMLFHATPYHVMPLHTVSYHTMAGYATNINWSLLKFQEGWLVQRMGWVASQGSKESGKKVKSYYILLVTRMMAVGAERKEWI